MLKDASYHRAAIQYNGEIADFAANLADKLEHPEVERWARSVAKQHRFHLDRHEKALDKIERHQAKSVNTEDGGEDTTVEEHVSTSPSTTPDGPDASQATQPVQN